MRALFAYLLAIGICLGTGYAEIVWLAKSFENAASRPQHSKDNLQSEATRIAHERSSTSVALNQDAVSPEAYEGEGKSLQTIALDSVLARIASDQSTGRAEETPAASAAETKGDHQTIGLGHREKNVNSPLLASVAPSEPDPLSSSKVGPRMTNEPRTSEESDKKLGKSRRGSQNRNYMRQQRFSELLKHPLELRCITCVLFNP